MNKEELKKEFCKWYVDEDEWENLIADWWLGKLDAYESSLLEKLEERLEFWRSADNHGSDYKTLRSRLVLEELFNISSLIKEGRE